MTPGGAPSPYNPHTPGAGLDQPTTLQQEWQTTDIEVRIRDTHDDAGLSGQTGVIRGISVSCFFVLFFYFTGEVSSVIRNSEEMVKVVKIAGVCLAGYYEHHKKEGYVTHCIDNMGEGT